MGDDCTPQTPQQWVVSVCGGCCCLWVVITIITILGNINVLAPDEQVVVHYYSGDEVINGPTTTVLHPFRSNTRRKGTRLEINEYVVVTNQLTAVQRHVSGPVLFFMDAYDVQDSVNEKVVLTKDEFIKFVKQDTGEERTVAGPATIMPDPYEVSQMGVQRAIFINRDTAVLVRDKGNGRQRLITQQGVFFPDAYEEILEVRPLNRVMIHEVVVVRDPLGRFTIYSGSAGNQSGTSFFLQPFHEVYEMTWSDYSSPPGDELQVPAYASVNIIDTRERKMFFAYEVRTSDNVKLRLDGTLFWRIVDVDLMIQRTPDPEGDVWHHARAALIQAVSRSTLSQFMVGFNGIVMNAFNAQAADGFYTERGVSVISMELTRYEPTDASTRLVLQEIIQETTNRINRLQQQESENEVAAARLSADIELERQNTQLIQTQAENERLLARMEGEASGTRLAKDADSFIRVLGEALPDVNARVELYRMHKTLTAQNENTRSLSQGSATLFLTPNDMNLRLHMGGDARRQLNESSTELPLSVGEIQGPAGAEDPMSSSRRLTPQKMKVTRT